VVGLKIEVKFAGRGVKQIQVTEDTTVLELLGKLGVNRETVLVKVGGKVVPEEQPLKDGDRVEVFQIVSGG
jgi:thiamine biosynthesis protein ThiS